MLTLSQPQAGCQVAPFNRKRTNLPRIRSALSWNYRMSQPGCPRNPALDFFLSHHPRQRTFKIMVPNPSAFFAEDENVFIVEMHPIDITVIIPCISPKYKWLRQLHSNQNPNVV